jgi:hypothetical protein
MIDNRKGCTQWETRAARRIKSRFKNRRRKNKNKIQKRSWKKNRKEFHNWKHSLWIRAEIEMATKCRPHTND